VPRPATPFHLAPVDATTWRAAYALRPREDQEHFVAPNAYSMLEAIHTPGAEALVGYAGDVAVGFVMTRVDTNDGRPWIDRFMVGAEHQGRGHGRRLLDATMARLEARHPGVPIRLSVVPGNASAERLYRAGGFRPTGEVAHGERVFERPATVAASGPAAGVDVAPHEADETRATGDPAERIRVDG
jgi:diamine N-acetyltransferase